MKPDKCNLQDAPNRVGIRPANHKVIEYIPEAFAASIIW